MEPKRSWRRRWRKKLAVVNNDEQNDNRHQFGFFFRDGSLFEYDELLFESLAVVFLFAHCVSVRYDVFFSFSFVFYSCVPFEMSKCSSADYDYSNEIRTVLAVEWRETYERERLWKAYNTAPTVLFRRQFFIISYFSSVHRSFWEDISFSIFLWCTHNNGEML